MYVILSFNPPTPPHKPTPSPQVKILSFNNEKSPVRNDINTSMHGLSFWKEHFLFKKDKYIFLKTQLEEIYFEIL